MKNNVIFILILLLTSVLNSCGIHKNQHDSKEDDMKNKIEILANDLENEAYGNFFIHPESEQSISKVWNVEGNPDLLEKLVKDESLSVKARFLACVVLFSEDFTFVSRYDKNKIAEIYASALEQNLTGFSNSWGLLYDHEDEGPIGITFIMLGEESIPSLLLLLSNETLHNSYIGSEEATVGNGYNYRIKDVAAYYIGKIKNVPLKYFADFSDRDAQIDSLLSQISE